jgi:hypothetical protein
MHQLASGGLLLGLLTAAGAVSATSDDACAGARSSHGCSTLCGYESVLAGSRNVCLPASQPHLDAFPFGIAADDAAEVCDVTARHHGCCQTCGFHWEEALGECRHYDSAGLADEVEAGASVSEDALNSTLASKQAAPYCRKAMANKQSCPVHLNAPHRLCLLVACSACRSNSNADAWRQ